MHHYVITLEKYPTWAAKRINIVKRLRKLDFSIDHYYDSRDDLRIYISHKTESAITVFLLNNRYVLTVQGVSPTCAKFF